MVYGGYGCRPPGGRSRRRRCRTPATFPDASLDRTRSASSSSSAVRTATSTRTTTATATSRTPTTRASRARRPDTAVEAGWDAILIVNRHLGSADDDGAFCGSGGYPAVRRDRVHHPRGRARDLRRPAELRPCRTTTRRTWPRRHGVGRTSSIATGTFDGWGYMGLYSSTPRTGEPEAAAVDTYAIPEALNPRYAFGFGDLSIHEYATDPTRAARLHRVLRGWHAGVLVRVAARSRPRASFIDRGRQQLLGRRAVHGGQRRAVDRRL